MALRIAWDVDQVFGVGQQGAEQGGRVEQRGQQRRRVFGIRHRADRLQAAGGDSLEGGVCRGVALDQRVVIAEGDVGGNFEASGSEGLLRLVHQARVFGPGGVRALRAVGVVELGEGALEVVVVVLYAGVAGGLGRAWNQQVGAEQVRIFFLVDAAVGIECAALSRVRTHSVSFSCWLSAESPVSIVKSIGLCEPLPSATGLAAVNWSIWRIIESSICGSSASRGARRHRRGG